MITQGMSISDVSIRTGVADDVEQVTDIKIRSWANTYGPLLEAGTLQPFLDRPAQVKLIREHIATSETLVMVAQNPSGAVIGFALTHIANESEPLLESLHVAAEFQGQGVGTLLMRSSAAHLVARGYDSMRLGVIVGNVVAARFYEGLGAGLVGVEPVSWAVGVSHFVYRWPDLAVLTR